MPTLKEIIQLHHGALFSEWHQDDDPLLHEKYKKIFKAAAEAGKKHVVFERPPNEQKQVDEAVRVYAEIAKKNGLNAALSFLKPGNDLQNVLVLAGAYGMNLHLVDVAPRVDAEVFEKAVKEFKAFKITHPEARFPDYVSSLTEADMRHYSQLAGREMNQIGVLTAVADILRKGGLQKALEERVKAGDKLIANKIKERVGDEPFVGMGFGRSHGALIDETRNAYQAVDLDGALRLMYGESKIARIDITGRPDEPGQQPPDYRMHADGRIEPAGSNNTQISQKDRAAACQKHELKCSP